MSKDELKDSSSNGINEAGQLEGIAAVHASCHACKSEPMKPQPASGGDREC